MPNQYRMPRWSAQIARRLRIIAVIGTSAVVVVALAILLVHSGAGITAGLKSIGDICPSLTGPCP